MLKRSVSVLAWAAALLIAGGWLATQVPLEWVPKVELPEVRIGAFQVRKIRTLSLGFD